MLHYRFQNYEEFKQLFGFVKHNDGTCNRKNKILLAYIKNKELLHDAATNNHYDLLHLSDMAELESVLKYEFRKSGETDAHLRNKLHLMGNIYYSAIYETDENKGICEDGDTKAIRYRNCKTGKIFKMKAGKLYRTLLLETVFGQKLPVQVVTYLAEKFALEWQTYVIGRTPKNKLYVNRDFKRIYSSSSCEGDFFSCMVNKEYYEFYENSVDASAAYLENEEGKVIARCVIFNEVKDQDGNVWRLAERQYASDDSLILKQTLVDALIREGHIDGYKKVGAGCGDAQAFVDIRGESLANKKFWIKCDLDWEDSLSYQDSFKHYDIYERVADNYGSGSLSLDITDGSLEEEDNRAYDNYHNYDCDEVRTVYVHGREYCCDVENLEDFIYIDKSGEYHHIEDVCHCPVCDVYFLGTDGCDSEITGNSYCCEECMDKEEDEYKEMHWYYSDYDGEYYKNQKDITYYYHWNPDKCEYEECSISVKTSQRLLEQGNLHLFNEELYDTIDKKTIRLHDVEFEDAEIAV